MQAGARKQTMTKRIGILILLLGVITATGCNMPAAVPYPYPLTDDELRQTLAAQSLPNDSTQTSQPNAFGTITPGATQNLPTNPTQGDETIHFPTDREYDNPGEVYEYYTRSGDTLEAVSRRFNVDPERISSALTIPKQAFIPPGQLLFIPNNLDETLPTGLLLPDSEVINSPSTLDFQIRV